MYSTSYNAQNKAGKVRSPWQVPHAAGGVEILTVSNVNKNTFDGAPSHIPTLSKKSNGN